MHSNECIQRGGGSQTWSCTHACPKKFQTPPKQVVPCQQNCPLNTFLACFPYKMLTPKQVLILGKKTPNYEMTPQTRWTDILNHPFSGKLLFWDPYHDSRYFKPPLFLKIAVFETLIVMTDILDHPFSWKLLFLIPLSRPRAWSRLMPKKLPFKRVFLATHVYRFIFDWPPGTIRSLFMNRKWFVMPWTFVWNVVMIYFWFLLWCDHYFPGVPENCEFDVRWQPIFSLPMRNSRPKRFFIQKRKSSEWVHFFKPTHEYIL